MMYHKQCMPRVWIIIKEHNLKIITGVLLILGTLFRLHHIEFGLPQSFYADEPELAEPAIKYTYEIRDVLKNNNWYKLIPISYVYGTLPTYVYTMLVMGFSKFNGLLNLPFEKMDVYVFLRSFTALLSLGIPATAYFLHKKNL
jgi:hypothetical protein